MSEYRYAKVAKYRGRYLTQLQVDRMKKRSEKALAYREVAMAGGGKRELERRRSQILRGHSIYQIWDATWGHIVENRVSA